MLLAVEAVWEALEVVRVLWVWGRETWEGHFQTTMQTSRLRPVAAEAEVTD